MRNNIYTIIVASQIALVGTIISSFIGINVPIIRELIGVLYLIFIPGILLLMIIRIEGLNPIEWIFYSVCLSISFLMFLGLFMNVLYPLIGIFKPISLIPVVITLTISVVILLIIAIFKRENIQYPPYFYKNKMNINLNQLFLLSLLPVVSIIGTYLLNYNNTNILLIILILVISLIPIFILNDKLHSNLYCVALFAISLSLLFHYSLVSGYITGYDIQIEKYVSSQVLKESYWDPSITIGTDSLLSLTILAPFIR